MHLLFIWRKNSVHRIESASRSSRFNWANVRGLGTIIGTDAREARNPSLHQGPVQGNIPQAILHYNSRAAFPATVHMQSVAAQIDKFPERFGVRSSCRKNGTRAEDDQANVL